MSDVRTVLAIEVGSVRVALTTTGSGSRLPFTAGALAGLGAMTLALAAMDLYRVVRGL